MVHGSKRGTAYGIFNGLYGLALLGGATAMGALYGVSVGWLAAFVAAVEVVAAGTSIWMLRTAPSAPR
jgi:hypothetical protein